MKGLIYKLIIPSQTVIGIFLPNLGQRGLEKPRMSIKIMEKAMLCFNIVKPVENTSSTFIWSKNKIIKWPLVSALIHFSQCTNSTDVLEVKSNSFGLDQFIDYGKEEIED